MSYKERIKGNTVYRTPGTNKRRKLLVSLLQKGPVNIPDIIAIYEKELGYKVQNNTVHKDTRFLRDQGCPVEYSITTKQYKLWDTKWHPNFNWGEILTVNVNREVLLDALHKVHKEWNDLRRFVPVEIEEIENLITQLEKKHD